MTEHIKVESRHIRDVSGTLQTEASNLFSYYEAMLNEVRNFTSNMSGTTIDAIHTQFNGMTPTFDRMRVDMQSYSTWLAQAADDYERLENEQTAQAQQQGVRF